MKQSFISGRNIPNKILGGKTTMKKISVLVLALVLVLGMSTAAFAASFNNPTLTVTIDGTNQLTTVANDTDNDNNVNNANLTGKGVGGQAANFNEVIHSDNMTWKDAKTGALKESATQRTHGEYQNNTNSCASCHQTHTAAAKDLLFKNSVYNTCTACHDGTLGFYNVFANGADASSAGTFGGTLAGNASMHLASGAVQIKAAPGGNAAADTEGGWSNDFSCNSCHTPHGSYGDRLLHFDPNGMADVIPAEGGTKVVGEVYAGVAALPAAVADKSVVVADTYNNVRALGFTGNYATNNPFVNGTVSATAQSSTIAVVVTGVKNNTTGVTSWKVDTTPWFYEYEFDAAHKNRYYAAGFWKSTEATWANNEFPTLDDLYAVPGNYTSAVQEVASGAVTIDAMNAFAFGDFTGLQRAAIGRVIIAKVPVVYDKTDSVSGFTYGATNPLFYSKSSYGGTTGIASGTGIALSRFCAACHTDYFTKSGALSGMFGGDQSFRHTTNSDSYMCLRCHFAHGTDVEVMKDSKDRGLYVAGTDGQTAIQLFAGAADPTASAIDYLKDQNPSSALKRYTNMAVCWKCHTSSHSAGFKNTDYYRSIGVTGGTTTTSTNSAIPSGF